MKKLLGVVLVIYVFLLFVFIFLANHHSQQYLSDSDKSSTAYFRPTTLPDFSAISDTKEKKQHFFEYFTQFIDQQNQRLLKQRQELKTIETAFKKNPQLSKKHQQQLKTLSKQFHVETPSGESDIAEQIRILMLRVNIIPSSLALAQAANESAWGTSRFARQGYNYFGQWCYKKGCGLIPHGRVSGASHEVRKFDSPAESVAAYFSNINTHRAYRELRQIRQQADEQNKPISGILLAEGLGSYSEKGTAYIHELQAMIRYNKLEIMETQRGGGGKE